jgi:flagellar basal-body rod protein FlgG
MPDGLHAAAAGMAAQQAWLDALSNDIANVNTDGYRGTRVAFRDLVDEAGATADVATRSERQGALTESGEPLSLAIDGPGWFQVKTADGQVALTRAGTFRPDADGSIVTAGGAKLEPPIQLPKDVDPSQVRIRSDGVVEANGKELGKITLVDVPAPDGLVAAGEGLFRPTAASGAPAPVAGGVIRQGYLETSNVDMPTLMTDLMQAQRAYQLQSRALQMQDQLREIANGIRR